SALSFDASLPSPRPLPSFPPRRSSDLEANGITLHAGVRVESIDVPSRQVHGANGLVEPYDVLVIATGSRPLVPPIDGLSTDTGGFKGAPSAAAALGMKKGVFVFRTLVDCDRILAYAQHASCAAVIGGGLLGLEAAEGLLNGR